MRPCSCFLKEAFARIYFFDALHLARSATWAALDVDASYAKESLNGSDFWRFGRCGSAEKCPTFCKSISLGAPSQDAVVPDTLEAGRQHMQQKAANKRKSSFFHT
jgi:hypothetical protein